MEKNIKKNMCLYRELNHSAVHQKLTHHCKSTILQLKKKEERSEFPNYMKNTHQALKKKKELTWTTHSREPIGPARTRCFCHRVWPKSVRLVDRVCAHPNGLTGCSSLTSLPGRKSRLEKCRSSLPSLKLSSCGSPLPTLLSWPPTTTQLEVKKWKC